MTSRARWFAALVAVTGLLFAGAAFAQKKKITLEDLVITGALLAERGVLPARGAAFISMSGGACELVESEDRLDEAMDRIHRRFGTPVLTELQISGEGLKIERDALVPSRSEEPHV